MGQALHDERCSSEFKLVCVRQSLTYKSDIPRAELSPQTQGAYMMER